MSHLSFATLPIEKCSFETFRVIWRIKSLKVRSFLFDHFQLFYAIKWYSFLTPCRSTRRWCSRGRWRDRRERSGRQCTFPVKKYIMYQWYKHFTLTKEFLVTFDHFYNEWFSLGCWGRTLAWAYNQINISNWACSKLINTSYRILGHSTHVLILRFIKFLWYLNS